MHASLFQYQIGQSWHISGRGRLSITLNPTIWVYYVTLQQLIYYVIVRSNLWLPVWDAF